MNAVDNYYLSQAGSGLSGFSGIRYQKGGGIFGSIWSRIGLPVLKFLGKQLASSGLSIAADALDGKDFKKSAVSQLKQGGKNTVAYLGDILSQQGQGRKRQQRTASRKNIKKRKMSKRPSVVKQKPKKKQRKSKRSKFDINF